ncbi:mitochondrial 37S ribosomal protein rsm10 [Paramarasmius palmivorus]|uniref:Mitochondrial 37S ribosomal protein rsm10 n=1 Tax=Paramarasmius palmivorus TaxID=297713 RepID=A0AAW0CC98_9AGAR
MLSALARAAPRRLLSLSAQPICRRKAAPITLTLSNQRTNKTLASRQDRDEDEEELEQLMNELEAAKSDMDEIKTVKTETPRLATSETEMFGSESFLANSQQTPSVQPQTPLAQQTSLEDELGPDFTEEQYASHSVHGRGIHLPYFHPQTHSLPVAVIHFRSHHPKLLDLFTHFSTHAASALGIPTSRVIGLPTQRSMWTVLRSPFIYKKSQENFERRVYKRCIKAYDTDPEVVDRWFKYLMRHEMGGVGMRMIKWDRVPVGIGAKLYGQVKKELERTGSGAKGEIKKLGQQIVEDELRAVQEGKASGKVVTAKVSS